MSANPENTGATAANGTTRHQGKPAGNRLAGKILRFVIPLAVSVGLCVAMFHDIDFHRMMEVIRHDCNFRWIGLMLAISFLPLVFRAMRWGIQLRAVGIKASFRVLLYSMIGTYAVNLVFPRLGEVWRSGYVAYREDAPFPTVFGSMISDRFADLVTVAILTAGTFIVARHPLIEFIRTYPQAYRTILHVATSPVTWISMAAAAGTMWWLLAKSRNRLILKLKHFLQGIWKGFISIVRMKGKLPWLGLTACIWGCYFLGFALAFHSFPMTQQMLDRNGIILPLVCFVLTSISMGIPSNGGIGPYQTTLLFGLMLFAPAGTDMEQFKTVGAAFGNVLIASQTAMFIILGLITFGLIALNKKKTKTKNRD